MPKRGYNSAALRTTDHDGPAGDGRMWAYLALRPVCSSDLEACQRLTVSQTTLATWRHHPYFTQLERQVTSHMADLLWLPRQRARALQMLGIEVLEQGLRFGDPSKHSDMKIRLEAYRALAATNGLGTRLGLDGDGTSPNMPATIDLSKLSDTELEQMLGVAHSYTARLLTSGAEPSPTVPTSTPSEHDIEAPQAEPE